MPPTTVAFEPAAFAEATLRELGALSPGVTPAGWLAGHPDDELERFAHRLWQYEGANVGEWCARARHEERIEDRMVWVRHAYFYVPEPPSPATLPAEEEARDLVMTRCQLGLIRVEATEPDAAAGRAVALALRDTLSRAYSRAPGTSWISLFGSGLGFGSRSFDAMSHWRLGELQVLSAYQRRPGTEESASIFATAALPISGMAAYRERTSGTADALSVDEDLITQAVVAGGLDATRAEPVRHTLRWRHDAARADSAAGLLLADQTDVASIIERWLATAPRSRGRERAGALIVAHVLLRSTPGLGMNSQDQARLRTLGARFAAGDDEGPPAYTGNWLRDAWAFDKGGAAGDVALPLLIDDGCGCPGRQDCFRWTIKEGERFLSRPHDRETMLQVHLIVASAYSQGVALAERAEEEIHQPYRAHVDAYRAKAIAHYRVAFAMGLSADTLEEHWSDVWRLIAGLPPLRTPFLCGC